MLQAPTTDRTGLEPILESLIQLIEHRNPAMRCSVLLLESGDTLRHGAAPSLPADYCRAIDGLRIGAGVGSCGTAAHERSLTIVADIATHPYWAPYRELALGARLRSCWSTPIIGSNGACLGTFAMYYDEPREPSASDLELIQTASVLASALIEREVLLATTEADRRALAEANDALEERQLEYELANQQLQDNAAELEAMNQQLLENAAELQAQAEAQVLARLEVEEARAEAERANSAKSKFLATMSHELRTPLNAIGGYADLLLAGVRGELTPAQRDDVERIQRSGRHLLGLINDILLFARIEAGRMEYHLENLRVASLLQAIEEMVRPEIEACQLTYTQTLSQPELTAHGDAEKVRRILLNLVTNAIKFTDPGGRVDVSCDAEGDRVRFRVRDTGRGMHPDQLHTIFDPFVQLERERTPAHRQGVGLGLSICRDLAHALGGSLQASSNPGEGSTFTLLLPAARSHSPRETSSPIAP